jgi:RNA polymerase sigma factor (sigma-70 family)
VWKAPSVLSGIDRSRKPQQRWNQGDEPHVDVSAWKAHERWLRAVVVARLRGVDAVSEVLQEVFLAALRSPQLPASSQELTRWLYRVAVRQAVLYRRKLHRQKRRECIYAALRTQQVVSEVAPEGGLLAQERRQLLHQALARLPGREAEILLLKYTHHWTYDQLANHLGISREAVKLRLHRARSRLRQLLDGRL